LILARLRTPQEGCHHEFQERLEKPRLLILPQFPVRQAAAILPMHLIGPGPKRHRPGEKALKNSPET
jgi:hypothetical protein